MPAFVFAFAFAVLAPSATSALEQASDDEPWGYVYVFRTLKLHPLVGDDVRLGRLAENQIQLSSARVSRRHAAIQRTDTGPVFVDVGSSNGSRVDGIYVEPDEPAPLSDGVRLQLADELMLYHSTLAGLWNDELRLRLLTSLISLRIDLPEDRTRKSMGREEIVPASTQVVLDPEAGKIELDRTVDIQEDSAFPEGRGVFVETSS